MMSPIAVGIVILVGYLLIIVSRAPQYVAFSYIITLFMFAIAIGLEKQGYFYALFALYFGILALGNVKNPWGEKVAVEIEPPSGRFGIQQVSMVVLGIFGGVGMAFLMLKMVTSQGYSILGFPTFAIGAEEVASVFAPALGGALGLVENRAFMTLRNVFTGEMFVMMFPFISIFLPILAFTGPVVASGLFGLFHISAYAAAAGSMFFAAMIFFIWTITDKIGFGTLIADVSHYIYNFVLISTTMGLAII